MTRFVEAGSAAGFLFLPALEVVPDHVHLFVKHEPKASASLFVASVGAVSADTVEKYIDTQWERLWTKKQKEEEGERAPGV